ncbi:MAG: glycosyltransferase family 4 protein [Kiritimatiellae bacterium]|nr:glycosyltransferase family 4 protein [Kiritimatiellia bacterium]
MSKITILHFCEHFGGAEASLHGVARAFQWWIPNFDKSRFRILLCSRKGRDKAAAQMEETGLTPFYIGYGKMDPRNLFKLILLLKKEKVEILHAHGFGASMWGRLAGQILNIPVIVHARCNYHTVPLVMRPVEWLLGPGTKYAFAVSESTRQYTIQKRHIPESAVKVLYNGILLDKIKQVDLEWIKTFRTENGATTDTAIIGVVGRIVSHKGHIDTFKAIHKLRQTIPSAQLWILGDGDYMPELQKWVKDNQLEDAVRFFGFRKDVIDIIQCFDVQVFPSHFEGTPNTLFEAMAVGNCIVATPTDGQGEILEDNETAVMFKVGDPEDMANKLAQVLTNKELTKSLRANALKKSKDFDGMKCIETMQNKYEDIV